MARVVNGLGASSHFYYKQKMDFVAANVFRALGARPIRDVSVRARGRLGHLPFGIYSIASIGLMGHFGAGVVVGSFALWC